MNSASTFGADPVTFAADVAEGERIRFATDDPSHIIRTAWTDAGGHEFGGTGYGELIGGVFTPGPVTITIQSGGPGTAFVESIPPLPE